MPIGIGGNLNLGNVKGISKTVKGAKLSAKADAVGMVAEIVGMVGTAIITKSYEVKNAKLQQQIEENLAKLSDAQREEIRDNLQKISDSNDRLYALINYLADNLGTQSALSLKNEISANLTGAVSKETKQIYWFIGISVTVLIAIVVLKKVIK